MAVQRRTQKAEDLNLVPIMNLVTILIPFLIMAAQFVQLAVIDSNIPAISDDKTEPPPDEPPWKLSVALTQNGITIGGADKALGIAPMVPGEKRPPTIPCGAGTGRCTGVLDYNWTELTTKLNEVKQQHPDEENVIIVPGPSIEYEVIVKAMDASRQIEGTDGLKDLFPTVVIAGGVGKAGGPTQ